MVLNENGRIWIQISLKCVSRSLIANKPDRRQAITWIRYGPVHQRIYAALVGDEYKQQGDPAWISNYTHCKVWDEIAYPFLNFNGATVEV